MRKISALCILLLTLSGLGTWYGIAKAAPVPTFTIMPAIEGGTADISGTGFHDDVKVVCDAQVTLSDGETQWDVLGQVVTDGNGNFAFVAVIPTDEEPGKDPVKCTDSNQSATGLVLVLPLQFEVLDITAPGETTGQATAENSFGQATVVDGSGSYWGANYGTPYTAWSDLSGPGTGIIGDAINDDGVIGGCFNVAKTGKHDAATWKPPYSSFVDLPGLGASWYSINGISYDGWTAGAGLGSVAQQVPVVWSPNSDPSALPFIQGTDSGVGNAISGAELHGMYHGFVVGSSGANAAEWTFTAPASGKGSTAKSSSVAGPKFTVVKLPSLGSGLPAEAKAVNDLAEKAGDAYASGSAPGPFAVSWSATNKITTLGALPGGKTSTASGVNDQGLVVGTSGTSNGSNSAFLAGKGKMFNLSNAIPSKSGWRLTEALAINRYGQIVGDGLLKGHTGMQAFLLTQPGLVAGVAIGRQAAHSSSFPPGALRQVPAKNLSEFAPGFTSITLGGTVQWGNNGTAKANVHDATGLNLFSSTLPTFGGFAYTYYGAGTYKYKDSLHPGQTGLVSVAPRSAPATGKTSTVFQVYWAAKPAAKGFDYDVQLKAPGSKSYRAWETGVSGVEAPFSPGGGKGTYAFRARLRYVKSGKSSGWSLPASISVT